MLEQRQQARYPLEPSRQRGCTVSNNAVFRNEKSLRIASRSTAITVGLKTSAFCVDTPLRGARSNTRCRRTFAMSPGSISLKTQLLCTIVGVIVATAVALTTLAYRAQVESLERDARRAVRVAAQSRAEAIVRLIDSQQQRAQRFLIAAASLCGEP